MTTPRLAAFCTAWLLGCAASRPPGTATPVVIGESITIDSAALGETRRINIYVPPGHGGARLPVLYMPDGGLQEDFHHITGLVQASVANGSMRPYMVVGAEASLRAHADVRATLFVAEEDPRDSGGVARLIESALQRAAPPGLTWRYAAMPEERHATIFHPAALAAFRAVLAPTPAR